MEGNLSIGYGTSEDEQGNTASCSEDSGLDCSNVWQGARSER